MPLAREDIPRLFDLYRNRYAERDERIAEVDEVVRGQYGIEDPSEEQLENRAPNLILVAVEDTSEAAGVMPTVRVTPRRNTPKIKAQAAKQERISVGYLDSSKMELLIPQTVMDLLLTGLGSWIVWPDYDERLPIIERRDPRTCYPEPGFRPGQVVRRCMFAREVYLTQLPQDYQDAIITQAEIDQLTLGKFNDTKVALIEYFDTDEIVVAALLDQKTPGGGDWFPIVLERRDNRTGICPVIIGSRITFDAEFRGQYDQVVNLLKAYSRLWAMVLDYADQAVYSDLWVRDPIGEVPFGGGSYIQVGPNGAVGRVPPAVSSLNIQADIQHLVDSIHIAGRWPKSRPGDVDQAIASAKFVEATAGMMNTAIRTLHMILKRMIEQAIRVALLTDQKHFPGPKTIEGILRNQEFVEEYDASKDIDMRNRVRVEYGLGLGRDPAQSAVLMLQYASGPNPFISHEWVQENIDGLTDVSRELARIDTEKMRQMMLAEILNGLQGGTISKQALPDLIEARENGEDLVTIYRRYVIEPAQQQMQSGLPGQPPMMPGMPNGGEMGQPGSPGGAPGQASPPVPTPPSGPELLSRLGAAAGPGSFLSSQVGGPPRA